MLVLGGLLFFANLASSEAQVKEPMEPGKIRIAELPGSSSPLSSTATVLPPPLLAQQG